MTARHPRATLAATILGSSVAFIDGSVVNVALPTLARDLDAGPAALAWTIDAYLLPLGALTLLGGALGDRHGRRRLFLIGLALFTGASLACAVAPSLPWLIAARAVQGVGAALLLPNSLAILGVSFDDAARGRAIGTWAAAGALTGALGPLVGGALIDASGWRTIFVVNLPLAAIAGWLAWRRVDESGDRSAGASLDVGGALFATLGLSAITWALTVASDGHGTTAATGLAALVGVASLVACAAWERRRGDAALMPPSLFATSTFVGLTLLTFFLYASLGGLVVALPFVLIRAGHYTATGAGAAMIPLPLVIGFGSLAIGGVATRTGVRWLLSAGALVVAIGLALYLRVDAGAHAASADYWTRVFPATLVTACGMAVCVAPLTTAVMASVSSDHAGAASGFNSAVARVAGLVATALLGFVFAASPADLGARFHAAVWVGVASALLAAASALVLIREPSRR